jgi:TRAP-type C4-dicarboxylate transport system permease small subunit
LHELVVLLIAVAAAMAVTTITVRLIGPALRIVELVLVACSVIVILFVMAFVGAEVLMRYAFNSPIPGHLEGSELLMPILVFLALGYTQATNGHVGMDLVLDALPSNGRRFAVMASLLIAMFVCSVLTYFAAKNAYQLWDYDDVTMTPPYFRTWPAAAAIPLGYFLTALRMYLQLLHVASPQRFPAYEQKLYSVELVDE